MAGPLIVVLCHRLQNGQAYVKQNWPLVRIEGQNRASVEPPLTPFVIQAGSAPVLPKKTDLIPLRIVTTEEQLRGLEVTEIHVVDDGVDHRMITLAHTRKR